MKLDYKRTVLVGFAFFLILAFWQAYDSIIPLILTNKFGMSQFWSGAIMALDNILALFLLPFFGAVSDKHTGKGGRRTPFIRFGTIAAVILLVVLTFADAAQLKNISAIAKVDDPEALGIVYDAQKDTALISPEQESYVLSEKFTREEFVQITSTIEVDGKKVSNEDYINYVGPARQAQAWAITTKSPQTLVVFVGVLLLLLVAMASFRSPAVALMPDVTMKPLRSKANAVINLLGYLGGAIIMVLGKIFATGAPENEFMSYQGFFFGVAALMLVALVVFLTTVRENKWVAEMQEESRQFGLSTEENTPTGEKRRLSAGEKKSLFFILASVILWYFGYNAVTTKYSVYATKILQKDFNMTLLLATVSAVISFVPVGIISSKIGRKNAILAGVVMLTVAFSVGIFARANTPAIVMNGMFVVAGIAWATINVNSFPMVVEMCSDGDVGKYTGYYYTASMAAQTITPMVSGFFMEKVGMTVLFPYAAIFVGLAFVTMLFVKHGDTKPEAKKSLEALNIEA